MIDHLDRKLLWTSREAAAALSLSERTLWKLTNEGDIPCVRIGAQKNKAQRSESTAELS
jgi:hypothetical protein